MSKNLEAYSEPFKAVVLDHIQKSLPASEWSRLRSLAVDRKRSVNPDVRHDPDLTPSSLLEVAVTEEGISVEETLTPELRINAVEIGQIEGMPVLYVNDTGIYHWGMDPVHGFSLSFWISFPAYPPEW